MIDVKELTDVLIEHDLTIQQYYILCILRNNSKEHNNSDIADKYIKHFGRFAYTDIEVLINRKLIEDFNSPGETYVFNYMVHPINCKDIFADDDMAEEIWNEYPSYMMINTKKVTTKSEGDDAIKDAYLRKIRHSAKLHDKVMKAIRLYKESNQYANMKLMTFIQSKEWENILKDTDGRVKPRVY